MMRTERRQAEFSMAVCSQNAQNGDLQGLRTHPIGRIADLPVSTNANDCPNALDGKLFAATI
jgi:hypothetical protein